MPETAPAPATTETPSGNPPAAPATPEPGAWRNSLPDDIRGEATFGKYNDVASLAKSHLELQKKMGVPSLPKPQDTWTEKEYGELWNQLGRPENPEGYGFKPLEKIPEGLSYSPEQDKWFAEQAHKTGLTSAQASALREQWVNYQAKQAEGNAEASKAYAAKIEEGTRKLQMEYGTKYTAALDGAEKVVQQYGSDELKELLKTTGLHKHPAVMGVFAKIGQVMMDHSVITGVPRISGNFGGSPSSAQAELQKMDADPAIRKILATARDPQHDAMVKRRAELHRAMVPVPE